MSDLISRQAAIDEIKEIYEWHDNVTKERIIEHFKRLPSAEPEQRWISCGDCKHYKIDHPRANGYHCCYRMHSIFPMKPDDFCSYGDRREDGEVH